MTSVNCSIHINDLIDRINARLALLTLKTEQENESKWSKFFIQLSSYGFRLDFTSLSEIDDELNLKVTVEVRFESL